MHRQSLGEALAADLVHHMTRNENDRLSNLPNGHHLHKGHGTSSTDVRTVLPRRRAVSTIRSAPSDEPPIRSTASHRSRTRSATGWKISASASPPLSSRSACSL